MDTDYLQIKGLLLNNSDSKSCLPELQEKKKLKSRFRTWTPFRN